MTQNPHNRPKSKALPYNPTMHPHRKNLASRLAKKKYGGLCEKPGKSFFSRNSFLDPPEGSAHVARRVRFAMIQEPEPNVNRPPTLSPNSTHLRHRTRSKQASIPSESQLPSTHIGHARSAEDYEDEKTSTRADFTRSAGKNAQNKPE